MNSIDTFKFNHQFTAMNSSYTSKFNHQFTDMNAIDTFKFNHQCTDMNSFDTLKFNHQFTDMKFLWHSQVQSSIYWHEFLHWLSSSVISLLTWISLTLSSSIINLLTWVPLTLPSSIINLLIWIPPLTSKFNHQFTDMNFSDSHAFSRQLWGVPILPFSGNCDSLMLSQIRQFMCIPFWCQSIISRYVNFIPYILSLEIFQVMMTPLNPNEVLHRLPSW